ncbi:MAG: ABC transporter substrate-binding protein [Bacteriovoracaceae bacterium]
MVKLLKLIFILLMTSSCIDSKPKLRIGVNPWPGYELLVTAKYFKKYEKHGLDVEIIEYGSLSDVRTAFINNHIDVMASTLIEVITAQVEINDPIEVLFATDYSNGPDVILSRVDNIKGKKIGCELGSLSMFMLGMALEKKGLSFEDVEVIPADQSNLEELFLEDEIDAGVSYPPFSVKLLKKIKGLNVSFSSKEIPYNVIDVVSIRRDLIKKHPEIKQKMMKVWDEMLEEYDLEPDKVIPLMAKREKVSVSELKDSLEGIVFLSSKHQAKVPFQDVFNKINDILFSQGQIKKRIEFNLFDN